MASPLTQPAAIGSEVVRVPAELVVIMGGADFTRRWLARHLAALKSVHKYGGKVVSELDTKPGPQVVAGHVGPRERV